MLPYYLRRLGKMGYSLSKSNRNGYNNGFSYYFKSKRKFPTIRLSNHALHPSQEIVETIDVVISDNMYTINKKQVTINGFKNIKRSSLEYVLLEIYLFTVI